MAILVNGCHIHIVNNSILNRQCCILSTGSREVEAIDFSTVT